MPVMNGIEAVKKIMKVAPCTIIMISSITEEGAKVTMEALAAGATDYIAKNSSFVQLDMGTVETELLAKVKALAVRPVTQLNAFAPAKVVANSGTTAGSMPLVTEVTRPRIIDIIVIGVSTVGPTAMLKFLKKLEPTKVPIVIAQHMPAEFTHSYAQHLASETGHDVVEGSQGLDINEGDVVVVPGSTDARIRRSIKGKFLMMLRTDETQIVHPSADLLFQSVLGVAEGPLAVIMTGMGSDGTIGTTSLREKGFPVFAQEPNTCAVDGMVSSAINAGVVSSVATLEGIASRLNNWCSH